MYALWKNRLQQEEEKQEAQQLALGVSGMVVQWNQWRIDQLLSQLRTTGWSDAGALDELKKITNSDSWDVMFDKLGLRGNHRPSAYLLPPEELINREKVIHTEARQIEARESREKGTIYENFPEPELDFDDLVEQFETGELPERQFAADRLKQLFDYDIYEGEFD